MVVGEGKAVEKREAGAGGIVECTIPPSRYGKAALARIPIGTLLLSLSTTPLFCPFGGEPMGRLAAAGEEEEEENACCC